MYLSKISYKEKGLGKACLASRYKFGAYKSHQQLWQLFSEESALDENRTQSNRPRTFLFREEYKTGKEKRDKYYLMLSQYKPKNIERIFNLETKEFNPHLTKGMKLAFSLRVNPTICAKQPGSKRGTRHDILMHAKRQLRKEHDMQGISLNEYFEKIAIEWLLNPKRSDAWGVSFPVTPMLKGWKTERTYNSSGNKISYTALDFEGILVVEDPEKFIKTLKIGVGSAKAFGCGLFLIKKI